MITITTWEDHVVINIPLYKHDRNSGMLGYPLYIWKDHHWGDCSKV